MRGSLKGAWGMWKVLPRALPYARRYWRLGITVIVLTIVGAVLGLAGPWPLAFLVDNVLGHRTPPGFITSIFGREEMHLLIFAVTAGLLITAIGHGITVWNEYVSTKLEQRAVLDLRSDLFEHAQRLSLTYHDGLKRGHFIYRINYQAGALGRVLLQFPALAQSLLTLVGMFWIAYRIDPLLALLSMTVSPFIYYSIGYYGKNIVPRVRGVATLEANSLSIVHEAMSMLRVIVSFGQERHEYRRFRTQGEQAVHSRIRLTVRQTVFSLVVDVLTAAGTALVLGFGAYHVLKGELTLGHLLVVMAYIAAVYKPMQQVSGTMGSMQEQLTWLGLAMDLLDTAPEIKEDPDAIDVQRARGDVAFDDVHFSYASRRGTLKGIRFEARAGQRVGLVGPTGAGKSTLVSLIVRFYDPDRGAVLIDGVDIRHLSLDSLRRNISVVLQESMLFSGTIAENIRYGKLDASMREIVAAAKAANAHDFIMGLPQRYETALGEGGQQLSGGERQRICIARAFLKDTPILILDEPTSSIDSKTEAVILDALERLMTGRTTFLIAHRLSTIRQADLILVLDQGKLVEKGTHEQLLVLDGLYGQLYDAQAGHATAYGLPTAPEENPELVQRITELADALAGSDRERAAQARGELSGMGRRELVEWARGSLQAGTISEAVRAVRVAWVLNLSDLAAEIVDRAAGVPEKHRMPFVKALRSFGLDPSALSSLLRTVDPGRHHEAMRLFVELWGEASIPHLQELLFASPEDKRREIMEILAVADRTKTTRTEAEAERAKDLPAAEPASGPRSDEEDRQGSALAPPGGGGKAT
jgi:ATP-binding cassette subfamily B protein